MNESQMNESINFKSIEYISLEIELKIQVKPSYSLAQVVKSVYEILSPEIDNSGKKGFFHLDNLTIGQRIYLSQILTIVNSINGIKSVFVNRFERLGEPTNASIDLGYIQMKKNEIARLDNDPNNRQNGVLNIVGLGGNTK